MRWKQMWTLPSQGGMWMMQNVGKWLEEAGRLEMSQWVPPYEALSDAAIAVSQVQSEEQQIQ